MLADVPAATSDVPQLQVRAPHSEVLFFPGGNGLYGTVSVQGPAGMTEWSFPAAGEKWLGVEAGPGTYDVSLDLVQVHSSANLSPFLLAVLGWTTVAEQ